MIHSLESVDSTHRYLTDKLKSGEWTAPVAVIADEQFSGRGSRDNTWTGLKGNLFLSFALPIASLPSDLKLESASLYFTYLFKEVLEEAGSDLWLKWPNDLYIDDKKIGGAITTLLKDTLLFGLGLNMKAAPTGFGTLDIEIERNQLLEHYFQKMKKSPTWKQIFRKYALEFSKNREYFTHNLDQRISLENAILLEDGSIECDGQRIVNLR